MSLADLAPAVVRPPSGTAAPRAEAVAYHRAYRRLRLSRLRLATGIALAAALDAALAARLPAILALHSRVASGLLEWVGVPAVIARAHVGPLEVPVVIAPTFLPHRDLYAASVAAVGLGVGLLALRRVQLLTPLRALGGLFLLLVGISGSYFFVMGDRFPLRVLDFSLTWTVAEAVLWFLVPPFFALALGPLQLAPARVLLLTVATLVYAVLFSVVRLATTLDLLDRAGAIWMAPAYFALGIFVDFVYVSSFYALGVRWAARSFAARKDRWIW